MNALEARRMTDNIAPNLLEKEKSLIADVIINTINRGKYSVEYTVFNLVKEEVIKWLRDDDYVVVEVEENETETDLIISWKSAQINET